MLTEEQSKKLEEKMFNACYKARKEGELGNQWSEIYYGPEAERAAQEYQAAAIEMLKCLRELTLQP